MAKVTLDMETFKALASQTRLQVLRALDERRKTLSELSKELELNKATVHEHLQLLVAVGLVKKKDEGRKWIYYELTWQGERLLHPQDTTTFSILLGLSVAAAGGGVFMLGRALEWWMAEQSLRGLDEGAEPGPSIAAEESMRDAEASQAPEDDASDGGSDGSDGSSSGASADSAEGTEPEGADESEVLIGNDTEAGDAADEQGGPWWQLDDPDGALALLLIGTAVLLAILAMAIRRRRRA